MRIAYENLIDALTAGSIIESTENPDYPAIYVQEERLTKAWRTTSVSSQSIIFDLGTAMEVETVAIIGHNLSASATTVLEANTSNSWPGATSKTITYNANMMLNYFSGETYRWWKLSIDDPTNTDGYLSIGRIWLGPYLSISPSSLNSFKVFKMRSDVVDHGRGRQKFASEGITWRKFYLSFPKSNYTMVKQIEDMFDYCGNAHSIIFCNFDTNRNYQIVEPCYCSINKDLRLSHGRYMRFAYELELEEEK